MTGMLVIARLTLVETMRRQIHLVTMFLALGICAVPILANAFGLGASDRIVKDVGLTLIGYYGLILALLLGSTAVPAEIERRTIYPLLARPIPRRAYLWGKWLGLFAFIVASLLVLAIFLNLSALAIMGHSEWRVLLAVVGYIVEAGLVSATCMLFSTFCSPPLAGVLGFFVYVMGGLPSAFIETLFKDASSWDPSVLVVRFCKLIMPHFELFHVKDAIVHGEALPGMYLVSVVLYGLAWVGMAHLLGEWKFERRDL